MIWKLPPIRGGRAEAKRWKIPRGQNRERELTGSHPLPTETAEGQSMTQSSVPETRRPKTSSAASAAAETVRGKRGCASSSWPPFDTETKTVESKEATGRRCLDPEQQHQQQQHVFPGDRSANRRRSSGLGIGCDRSTEKGTDSRRLPVRPTAVGWMEMRRGLEDASTRSAFALSQTRGCGSGGGAAAQTLWSLFPPLFDLPSKSLVDSCHQHHQHPLTSYAVHDFAKGRFLFGRDILGCIGSPFGLSLHGSSVASTFAMPPATGLKYSSPSSFPPQPGFSRESEPGVSCKTSKWKKTGPVAGPSSSVDDTQTSRSAEVQGRGKETEGKKRQNNESEVSGTRKENSVWRPY